MKKLIIGGDKPAEASDLTAMLRVKAGWATIAKALSIKDIAHVDAELYTEDVERRMVMAFPAHTVIKDGKEVPTLILFVHVPGCSDVPSFIEGYKECTLDEYNAHAFEPDAFTTVVLPERMRPKGDLKDQKKAWAASFDLLYQGRSVVSTATNLREQWILNAVTNSGYAAERIRIVMPRFINRHEQPAFNGRPLIVANNEQAFGSQCALWHQMRAEMPEMAKRLEESDKRIRVFY